MFCVSIAIKKFIFLNTGTSKQQFMQYLSSNATDNIKMIHGTKSYLTKEGEKKQTSHANRKMKYIRITTSCFFSLANDILQ